MSDWHDRLWPALPAGRAICSAAMQPNRRRHSVTRAGQDRRPSRSRRKIRTTNPPVGVGPATGANGPARRCATTRPTAKNIPTRVGTSARFDAKTGEWKKDKAKNIKWVAPARLANLWQSGRGQRPGLRRHQQRRRLAETLSGRRRPGLLLCFDEADGKFLWQHSSEKLPTGRVHDWPMQGVCATPLVEGNGCGS